MTDSASPAVPRDSAPPPLAVEGVSVALDGRLVLHDVSLQVSAGEFVVLLGANGSGKSTLVRASVGLVPTIAGRVLLFGTPLPDFEQRARIGYVPQRTRAVAGVPATVDEVVASGRLSRRRWFAPRTGADRAAIDDALERVDLADRRRSPVSELSGGQQQRVLIARALATEAELLVMDEPTAGVDHDSQHDLATLMGDLVHAGTSVLLVAHELGPMAPLIDRAVVLEDGRVRYDGAVDHRLDEALGHAAHAHFGSTEHAHRHTGAPPREGISGEGAW